MSTTGGPTTLDAVTAAPRRTQEPLAEQARLIQYRGALAVHSGPQGARAFVNGTEVGSTPIVLRDLPVGSRVLRLEAEGYQPWSAAVQVIAGREILITATLDRSPAQP